MDPKYKPILLPEDILAQLPKMARIVKKAFSKKPPLRQGEFRIFNLKGGGRNIEFIKVDGRRLRKATHGTTASTYRRAQRIRVYPLIVSDLDVFPTHVEYILCHELAHIFDKRIRTRSPVSSKDGREPYVCQPREFRAEATALRYIVTRRLRKAKRQAFLDSLQNDLSYISFVDEWHEFKGGRLGRIFDKMAKRWVKK